MIMKNVGKILSMAFALLLFQGASLLAQTVTPAPLSKKVIYSILHKCSPIIFIIWK